MIHDAGDEPALPACKEFLCLTARIFMLLHSMGVVEEPQVRGRNMEELNRIAIDAMLVTAALIADPELEKLKGIATDSLKAVLGTDSRGNPEARRILISRHILARERYRKVFDDVKGQIKKLVGTLLFV